jgi:hypothetical protein
MYKGWANGLDLLGRSEYFSNKYLGYIFRVSENDSYSVVQSSGRIIRMESSDGGPVLIVDFKGFLPPREGATLTGRYLRLDRVGNYATVSGGSRNAYFLSVAK